MLWPLFDVEIQRPLTEAGESFLCNGNGTEAKFIGTELDKLGRHGTCRETLLAITTGNTPIPPQTILGTLNTLHESSVQGKNMSEVTQMGVVLSELHISLRTSTKGCLSCLAAW